MFLYYSIISFSCIPPQNIPFYYLQGNSVNRFRKGEGLVPRLYYNSQIGPLNYFGRNEYIIAAASSTLISYDPLNHSSKNAAVS